VSVEVANVATPLLSAPVPRVVEPSRKVTVPVVLVGRVAVKITDWLKVEGLTDDVSTTAGDALLTVCVVDPVAGLLFVSPPNVAVIGSLPTGRIVVVIVTVPVVGLTGPLPRVVPPLVTVTVPVVPGGNVVVTVTGLPKVLGPDVVTVTVGVSLLTVWVRFAVAVLLFVSPL
jgi:hypothetical protein